jgi:hypothetical protein
VHRKSYAPVRALLGESISAAIVVNDVALGDGMFKDGVPGDGDFNEGLAF